MRGKSGRCARSHAGHKRRQRTDQRGLQGRKKCAEKAGRAPDKAKPRAAFPAKQRSAHRNDDVQRGNLNRSKADVAGIGNHGHENDQGAQQGRLFKIIELASFLRLIWHGFFPPNRIDGRFFHIIYNSLEYGNPKHAN